ncbi:MAG: hypothetical protein J6I49_00570 [Bacteroidales bacterium]|nr:hypothetical protein [Bacteroidales bacterium]
MKRHLPWLAIALVLAAMFNVCFFLITAGTRHLPPSVWIGYAFIHLALLLMLLTPLMVKRGNQAEADYRRPLYAGTTLYFFITLVINALFITDSLNSELVQMYINAEANPQEGLWEWLIGHLSGQEGVVAAWILQALGTPVSVAAAVITNTLLLGLLALYLIVNLAANTDTAAQQERHEQELAYVKEGASRLKYIAGLTQDRNLQRKVSQLNDLVSSSPLRSCPEASPLERKLLNSLSDLEDACQANDEQAVLRLCDDLTDLVRRRNRIVSEKA